MARRPGDLDRLSEEELLALPISSLSAWGLGVHLTRVRAKLHEHLAARGLRFRPDVWVSTDFFSPDGSPGFAVPFWLLHPRLARLERRYLGDVEGGSTRACLQLLAHETGHALQHAYQLHETPAWHALFGNPDAAYRRTYFVRPGDPRFVQNLPHWYAQSHAHEDYAETFAIWLLGRDRRYSRTPAGHKLRGLEKLIASIPEAKHRFPRDRSDELDSIQGTLAEHYAAQQRKRHREPAPWGDLLERHYAPDPRPRKKRPSALLDGAGSAARHLRAQRQDVQSRALEQTGFDRYSIAQALNGMILFAKQRGLSVSTSPPRVNTLVELTDRSLQRLADRKSRIAR